MLKKGDLIAVLDENIKGKIISINGNEIKIQDNDGFERYYFSHELVKITSFLDNQIVSSSTKKAKEEINKKQSVKNKTDYTEIDLHIEKLILNHKTLSNFEILGIQLDKVRTVLENAIEQNQPKQIIFIHGFGKGVLRQELHDFLDRYALDCTYFDASFQRYHDGATEVTLHSFF